MAVAPLATEAKVPFIIMNAGTSVIITRSPYIARISFTLWQSSYPLGRGRRSSYKTAYIAVSDYGPGHDSEAAFEKAFTEGGGKIVGKVRMPLANPDFVAVHAARQGRQARGAVRVRAGRHARRPRS